MPHVRPDLIMNVGDWLVSATLRSESVIRLTIDYPRFFNKTATSTASAIAEAIQTELVNHLAASLGNTSINLKLSENGEAFAAFAFGDTPVAHVKTDDLPKPDADEDTGLVFETTAWPRPAEVDWDEDKRHDKDYHDTLMRCWAPPKRAVYEIEVGQDLSNGGPWRLQITFPGGAPTTNSWANNEPDPLDSSNIGASKTYANGMLDEHDAAGFDPIAVCDITT